MAVETILNKRIVFWSVTSALAGFLFGFDTVVISGAEQKIQTVWNLNATAHGFAVASALYGTVLGALVGGFLSDRYGRRLTLLMLGLLYLVGALWSALATDVYSFSMARIMGGVGIGVSTVAAPLYISEISPARFRGRLAGMFQFNIVFGILIAYLSNALLAGTGAQSWRWMLGVAALPSLVYTLLAFTLPESPRWLIVRKHDDRAARAVLRQIDPRATDAELSQAILDVRASSVECGSAQKFWSWRLRRPIALAILIALFNQLSGINAILYFAPRIFELAGLGADAALLSSVGIGITNLVFTFVA